MVAMQSLLAMVMAYVGPRGRDDEGQTMAEYGLLLAGIAIVAMVGVLLIGPALSNMFTGIANELTPGP